MSKTIPYVGEFLNSGDFPALMRCAHLLVGPDTTNDVIVTTQATYDLLTLPAGAVVHNALTLVRTAFTASVTLTIGDSDSAAGFFASSDIVPQSTGGVFVNSNALSATAAYALGKQYAASQALQMVVGGATAAAGLMDVYVLYSMAYND